MRLILGVGLLAHSVKANAEEAAPTHADAAASRHAAPRSSLDAPACPQVEGHHEFLAWRAPDECPAQADVTLGIEALLSRSSEVPAGFSARAIVVAGEAGYQVELQMDNSGETGARKLAFSTCREVADFVVLAVALAIDPHAVASAPGTDARSDTAGQLNSHPADGTPLGANTGANVGKAGFDATRSELPEPAVPDPVPPPTPEPQPPAPGSPRAASSWFVTAGVQLTTGLLPDFAAGPVLGFGRRLGPWSFGGDIFVLPGDVYEFSAAPHAVRFRGYATSAGGCRLLGDAGVTAGLCARVQLGVASAREQAQGENRQPYGGVGFFLAVLFGMEGSIKFSRHFAGTWAAYLSWPALSSPFELADGTPVHQLSVGFQGSLGLKYFF